MVQHLTVLTWDLCSLSCKIGLCVTGESAWNIKSEKQLCIPSLLDPMSPPMLAMQIPISSQYDPNWSWNPTLKISMVPNMSTIHPAFQRVSQFVFWIESIGTHLIHPLLRSLCPPKRWTTQSGSPIETEYASQSSASYLLQKLVMCQYIAGLNESPSRVHSWRDWKAR